MIEICFIQGSGTSSEIQRLLGKAPPNFDTTGKIKENIQNEQ